MFCTRNTTNLHLLFVGQTLATFSLWPNLKKRRSSRTRKLLNYMIKDTHTQHTHTHKHTTHTQTPHTHNTHTHTHTHTRMHAHTCTTTACKEIAHFSWTFSKASSTSLHFTHFSWSMELQWEIEQENKYKTCHEQQHLPYLEICKSRERGEGRGEG